MFRALEVFLDLIGRFLRWNDEQKAVTEGREAERQDSAKAVVKEAQDAEQIRETVRAGIAADPDSLRDPNDPFARSD